uniref:Uncharacterized protein n=1 Tax=Manihot esculenta TaxID=3983 RepID=A0A2C9V916_MANES
MKELKGIKEISYSNVNSVEVFMETQKAFMVKLEAKQRKGIASETNLNDDIDASNDGTAAGDSKDGKDDSADVEHSDPLKDSDDRIFITYMYIYLYIHTSVFILI